jgi:exopolysaccharide biosynthesis polyprenyl glycosylphosphotransferase
MTPQLAAKLTIHEPHAVGIAGNTLVAFPGSPVGLLDGDERALPPLLRREALRKRLLCAADLLAATLASWAVLGLFGNDQPGVAMIIGMPLIIVLFKIAGLYDRDQLRIAHSTLDEAPILVQLTGLYALVVTILQSFVIVGGLGGEQIAALWVGSFLAVLGGRMLARSAAGRASPIERCLVIGDPELATRIRSKLASSGARSTVAATLPLEGDDLEHLSGTASLRRIVLDLRIDRIVIAPTTADAGEVVELIRIAKACGVRVSVLPRMLEVIGSVVEFEDLDGLTMLGVRPFGLSRSSRRLKRCFDLVAGAIGVAAVAPIMLAVTIAIRLDSPGPILFRQVRVGRDGRHFHILKFRSMEVGAEARKDQLRDLNEVGDGMFKITNDPRVTRVGGFLRRTSLDELPQIFNVLRGEMSLVGPRPLVTDEDAQVIGLDRSRLHLTPGMTGPWQILGARVPMQEMVGLDYLYVANWSLWQDVKLLVRTVRHVTRSGNV